MNKFQNMAEKEKVARFVMQLAMELRKGKERKSILINGRYRMIN